MSDVKPRSDLRMEVEMALDFDVSALRSMSQVADSYARTLRHYIDDMEPKRKASARSAVWKFENLAASCRRILDLQVGAGGSDETR